MAANTRRRQAEQRMTRAQATTNRRLAREDIAKAGRRAQAETKMLDAPAKRARDQERAKISAAVKKSIYGESKPAKPTPPNTVTDRAQQERLLGVYRRKKLD